MRGALSNRSDTGAAADNHCRPQWDTGEPHSEPADAGTDAGTAGGGATGEPTAFWGMVTEGGTRRVKLPLTLGGCRIDGRLAEFTELGKLMRT